MTQAHGHLDSRAGAACDPEERTDLVAAARRVQTLDQLGALLRRLRRQYARRHDIPQPTVRELAERSGYARGAVSEYLSGKTLPPTDRFDVLIRLLGAAPAEQGALATARDRVEERRRAGSAVSPVPRELPPGVPGFVGRMEELAELDVLRRRADRSQGEMPIVIVAGTAGVGKTALAIHWAHRVGARFPDGCLYLDLRGYDPDQPVAPADALAALLRSLGVHGAKIPPTEAERSARYRTLLAGRRTLVLLDNARGTEQVRPLLPGGSGCATLVTSRDALTGLVARHGARRIDLDPLPGEDAVTLLGTLIGVRVTDEPDAASALADQCAGLPLTLRLAAELSNTRPEATLADLVAELTDVRQRLSRLDAVGEPPIAVRAAFSWSYQNLSGTAARAFRLCGLYPGQDLDAYAMAALAGTDLDQACSMLRALARANLIQPAGAGRYAMHDLLRAYAAELAGADPEPERRAAVARLRSQQLYTCAQAMDLILPSERRQRPEIAEPPLPVPRFRDPPEATRWLDTERPTLLAAALDACGPAGDDYAVRLALLVRRYLDHGGHYQDAELLFRHAVTAATNPAGQARALAGLGGACLRLGRYHMAADHQERALHLARATGDPVAQGDALIGLGVVYWHLGRPGWTIECGRQAIRLHRGLGDRSGLARAVGNLGCTYNLVGNFPAALAYHARALAIFREVGDEAGMAVTLSNLGSDLTTLGRLPGALEYLREALTICRRRGHRTCQVTVVDNLGIVYRQMGQLGKAGDHHRYAVDLARATADRRSEGYAIGRLGAVYGRLGQLDRAVEHHHQALRIARELGDSYLATELCNHLGEAMLAWPRPRRALRSYRRALARALHHNRYEQARAHHGIARALALLDGGPAADRHRERALNLYAQLGVPPP
jgi:tetratricopeptide (TPR) repeat protein/transcriptional regulator with XRE-family HTH domain